MLDQDSALALFTVAAETGATLALVGDRAQLPAVGRGGVLDMAAQIRSRTVDMAEVHRFTDPAFADLTVRLRDRDDPGAIFDQLHALGLIRLHPDAEHLHEYIAQYRSDGEAVTVATNDEATRLNGRIRDERVQAQTVDDQATTTGSDGLPIGRGDLIQTRKNATGLGVANRQLWVVQHVADDGALWAVEAGGGRKREHTVRLSAAYVAEHTHLAYASTAYGVQGITAPGSHTVLTDAMSGAAVYVGMTRGTDKNQLHVVSENIAEARRQFIDAVERDRADRGLVDATHQAVEAVRGLVDDGPVKIVNTEIATLTQQAERAEQRAALWRQAADALTDLHARQRDERDRAAQTADAATRQLERVRAEVAAPLTEQASAALAEWQDADIGQQAARDRLRTVGRFGKRRATTEHHTARTLAHNAAQRLTREWGEPPRWNENEAAWVEWVTRPLIGADPRVVAATEQHEAAANAVRKTLEPDPWPRLRVYARIFGTDAVVSNRAVYRAARPHANAEDAARAAHQARAEIEALRALSPAEAVERIEQTRAAQQAAREAAERALSERQRQLRSTSRSRDSDPHYGGPSLGC